MPFSIKGPYRFLVGSAPTEGRIMAELYPKQQLQVIVLDASGHSSRLHSLRALP